MPALYIILFGLTIGAVCVVLFMLWALNKVKAIQCEHCGWVGEEDQTGRFKRCPECYQHIYMDYE